MNYNNFALAKIANPESDIYVTRISNGGRDDVFGLHDDIEEFTSNYHEANPADYCMTLEKFLSDGHKLEVGDVIFGEDEDDVNVVSSDLHCRSFNMPVDADRHIYILRAAALENIQTETPEEKEVLDGIESAGEAEWKNGDECAWNGISAVFIGKSLSHQSRCAIEYLKDNCSIIDTVFIGDISKPETPKQREERERLAAAYDLYECGQSAIKCVGYEEFNSFKSDDCAVKFWLAIVDKTKYRKQD